MTNMTSTPVVVYPPGGIVFFRWHGWFMWVTWGLIGMLQIITARYIKVFWKVNMWLHLAQGIWIFMVTIVIGLFALSRFSWHLTTDPHGRNASFVISTVGIIVFGGSAAMYLMNNLRWKTSLILNVKLLHRVTSFHP